MSKKEYYQQWREASKKTHKRVELNLPISEYEAFLAIVESQNKKQNVSALIAEMAINYRDNKTTIPESLEDSLKEINIAIRGIGNNINQIARNSNIYQEVDKKMFFDNLKELNLRVNDFVKREIKKQ
jgi:hypothetical protein